MPDPEEIFFPRSKERFEDRRKETQSRKLQDEFFDHSTLLAISRLITQGQFDSVDYPISTGKEGGVFRASGGEGYRAVKVYRIGNAVFRHLPAYAIEELRRETSDRNYARMVYAWTRREHSILRRMHDANVRVPVAYGYLRNVLVMEFIGADGVASRRLQEATVAEPQGLYDDLVVQLRRMTIDAKLVHGDLSPYNVLWHEGTAVLIDVAQSMESVHPQAPALLRRDIDNFARYLNRLGADVDAEEFFSAVGGPTLGPKKAA
jgi:RIO kinase 1